MLILDICAACSDHYDVLSGRFYASLNQIENRTFNLISRFTR
jgi:hypothetical protein